MSKKLAFRRRQPLLKVFFLIFLLAASFLSVCIAISPALCRLAQAGCGNLTQTIIYKAVSEELKINHYTYKDMVYVTRDDLGNIKDLQINTAFMNSFRSDLGLSLQEKLSDSRITTLSIPSGNLSGIMLLSGRGPSINVRLVPMGSISTDIVSEFTSAGINQTKHSIYITVKAEIKIMAPFDSASYTTEAKVPLSETVIVGTTPDLLVNSNLLK
ncbi:MAG: sporulation protein YunB [Bacillota bacterium]|nr:sporulation protein YunB [Bacillota bacterium]